MNLNTGMCQLSYWISDKKWMVMDIGINLFTWNFESELYYRHGICGLFPTDGRRV